MYQEKGNIVAEYNINGVRVLVSDAAYAGKSAEELDAIRKEARRIAWDIAVRYEARRQAAEQKKEGQREEFEQESIK
ncbi:hypothetical protein [uncultured Dysosmobacter sp.]|uniref:hypothetical protein n=1 Tax=uncultured Dysosmobacter sp. TaxID=2591384 RepID=UPI0026297301|nr:hypothetical protein [uncultured Dysosmobacter sp.]